MLDFAEMNELTILAVVAVVMALILSGVFTFANSLRRRNKASPGGSDRKSKPQPVPERRPKVPERDAPEHEPYKVVDLFIYPIKSCAGQRLDKATTCFTGFNDDRRYMFVNEKGRFMSQRQYPRMALIKPRLLGHGRGLELTAPGMAPLQVPLVAPDDGASAGAGAALTVTVWRDTFGGAVDQGAAAAEWVCRFLAAERLRLVHMPDSCKRFLSSSSAREMSSARVSFADGFPFLVASAASLRAVQDKAGPHIKMNRFRPNIVVDGCGAFEEDQWRKIRIGEFGIFHGRKRCVRCKIPTTDQETGEQAGTKAPPFTTLQEINPTKDALPLFGINMIHDWRGFPQLIACGEPVTVLRVTDAQPPL